MIHRKISLVHIYNNNTNQVSAKSILLNENLETIQQPAIPSNPNATGEGLGNDIFRTHNGG